MYKRQTTVQLAAQEAGAYCVGYNVATPDVAPEAYMTAAIFNWANFYTQNVQAIIDGTWKGEAYWEGMDKGWVDIDALTALAPEGAAEKVEEVKAQIIDGTFDPFPVSYTHLDVYKRQPMIFPRM